MGVTGSECPQLGRNEPNALSTYLMYLFEAQAVGTVILSLKANQICMLHCRPTSNTISTHV